MVIDSFYNLIVNLHMIFLSEFCHPIAFEKFLIVACNEATHIAHFLWSLEFLSAKAGSQAAWTCFLKLDTDLSAGAGRV